MPGHCIVESLCRGRGTCSWGASRHTLVLVGMRGFGLLWVYRSGTAGDSRADSLPCTALLEVCSRCGEASQAGTWQRPCNESKSGGSD